MIGQIIIIFDVLSWLVAMVREFIRKTYATSWCMVAMDFLQP